MLVILCILPSISLCLAISGANYSKNYLIGKTIEVQPYDILLLPNSL